MENTIILLLVILVLITFSILVLLGAILEWLTRFAMSRIKQTIKEIIHEENS